MNRRWGASLEVQRVAERLREFPTDIGPWHMRESEPLSTDAAVMLECVGYVGRQYENRETGEVVAAAVLLGPAGPISVHTPEVCYSSRDYTFQQPRTRIKLGPSENPQDELWSTTLQSTRLDASYLRVYYGWSTGGPWSAPADGRFAFAGKRYLYKIQVAGVLPSMGDESASDPALSFLKASLPVVKQLLVESVKE
jgi:hypothetical protein